MSLPPKTCPECGEEYLHTATQCVHCEVPLVLAGERDAAAAELPPISELRCVRAASVDWAVRLSERLQAAGIPHRIEAAQDDEDGGERQPGRSLPYGVYVRPADLDAAARIDAEHLAAEIPDLPEGFEAGVAADDEHCPACGEPLDPGAAECGDCGLALAPPE